MKEITLALVLILIAGCSGTVNEHPDLTHPLKIGFGSCISNSETEIWRQLKSKDLDLFLFLGDNVYQSRKHYNNPDALKVLYNEVFESPDLRSFLEETPHIATWDDHDFGPNNSDSTFEGKAVSLSAFKEHWKHQAADWLDKDSIRSKYRFHGVTILITDNRSFRLNADENLFPAMFGQDQIDWLEQELLNPEDPIVILVSGNQLFSNNYKIEALREYPLEQKKIRELIAKSPARVLVISGDRHYSELLKTTIAGKEVYEITASPLSSRMVTSDYFLPDKNRLFAYTKSPNFGVLEIDSGNIRVMFYDQGGKLVMARKLRFF